jgi:hypothetical protein
LNKYTDEVFTETPFRGLFKFIHYYNNTNIMSLWTTGAPRVGASQEHKNLNAVRPTNGTSLGNYIQDRTSYREKQAQYDSEGARELARLNKKKDRIATLEHLYKIATPKQKHNHLATLKSALETILKMGMMPSDRQLYKDKLLALSVVEEVAEELCSRVITPSTSV